MATRLLAAALLLAAWGMTAFSFFSLTLPQAQAVPDAPGLIDVVLFGLIFVSFPGVGFLVAWSRPRHPVGWLLLVVGVSLASAIFSSEYANVAIYQGHSLPAVPYVAWLNWGWLVAGGIAIPLLLVLYPDGRLPGARWRAVMAAGVGLMAILTALTAVAPGPLHGWEGQIENPFGVEELGGIARAAETLSNWLFSVMATVSIAGLVVKFRRSRDVERQQFKWLLLPALLFAGGLSATLLSESSWLWWIALLGLIGFPVAIGIAILRHRLFDIDLVIRRTLTYALVVGVLGVVYVGLVLALQAPLAGVTGGGPLPVALSTLAVAALFGPVRARVREIVERRFYRSRYDAQQTLDHFSVRLRDEVELDAVARSLTGVAGQTVRPSAVGVWIRAR